MQWVIVDAERAKTDELTGLNDVLTQIFWECGTQSAELDDSRAPFFASYSGVVTLPPPDPAVFVEFQDLNMDDCIDWVMRLLGEAKVAEIEKKLGDKLEAKLDPKHEYGTPSVWGMA